jgi:hypothetical protein
LASAPLRGRVCVVVVIGSLFAFHKQQYLRSINKPTVNIHIHKNTRITGCRALSV